MLANEIPDIETSLDLGVLFLEAFPDYMKEIAISLLPIVVFFGIFQVLSLKLEGRTLLKIVVGLVYTYLGLVLFLTGVNVGFMPAGNYLGQQIAALPFRWIIIPIGMLIGYFIVMAEPAVYVLTKQVEELTDGAIPGKAMETSLSIGVACSVGLAICPGVKWNFYSLVFDPWLCHCTWLILFCAKNFYSHCF